MCKNNNINSVFQTMASGVPQGSILSPILFNIFFNYIFFFLCNMSVHNFADENTLSSFAKAVNSLVSILKLENGCAIYWFRDDSMIVNPRKFQSISLDKGKYDLPLHQNITNDKRKHQICLKCFKMLDVHINRKSSFN